jgi:excisionase family DNA binding protein
METGSHLQRMSGHCALMASRLQLDPDALRAASRLHDVGMSQLGPTVSKRGSLTRHERDELAHHPRVGHVMLSGSGVGLLDTAAEIALTHHERFDGSGYPDGLRGEGIPLVGRIAAVADAFDALTTDRPYRRAGSVEKAAHLLRAERGHQFDPRVVDAFLDQLPDAIDVLERTPDAPGEHVVEDVRWLSLQVAAAMLVISPSRLRRWADIGRIETIRTAGGHRRFPFEAVRRLADERGVRATVRPLAPPSTPLPLLARCLRARGREITLSAAAAVYRHDAPGWFASPEAAPVLLQWSEGLTEGCARGEYSPALAALQDLMELATAEGATLLECHTYLQRFAQLAMNTLVRASAKPEEMADARRLLTSLQEAQLSGADVRAGAR